MLKLDFRLLSPKKVIIEDVVVGVGGKLVPLEAFQSLIFFSHQSTIVKEGIYQKSDSCLHFYSRDAILKNLENPFIF